MSEKCEHIQVFCNCKTIKGKVFQEGYDSGFQAGEKKGRQKELLECFEHKEEHNRQVNYLVDQARSEAFDETIEEIKDWYNSNSETKFGQMIDRSDVKILLDKLKERGIIHKQFHDVSIVRM